MKTDYSDKEYAMIAAISPHWQSIIDRDLDNSIVPPLVFEIVALDCFMENKTGKAVDSLRRCVAAVRKCNPYRRTPEFDALIDL